MGLKHTEFFENNSYEAGDTQIIVCNECSSHLCLSSLVLLDKFWGSSGEAYLVDKLINIQPDGMDQETKMKTGVYLINKISCQQCFTNLGWLYKKLYSYSESYKEGKFVIEKKFIRQIPNHSTTAALIEQAKLLRRRRSSASNMLSNLMDEESILDGLRKKRNLEDFTFSGIAIKEHEAKPRRTVMTFREGISHALSRLRFLGIDKDDFDEHDEETNVFVDV